MPRKRQGGLVKVGDLLRQTDLPAGQERMLNEVLAVEAEAAKEAGALGFMTRALVQATMPHKRVNRTHFVRENGLFRLEMVAMRSDLGLPYGNVPRLLMAWVSTEAVRTRERMLILGDSLSDFMRKLGMMPTGGRWGSITRLRAQSERLFSTAVTCTWPRAIEGVLAKGPMKHVLIAEDFEPWWEPKNPDQRSLFRSTVVLSERFFREIVERPVPIDLRVLKGLSRSPMQIDIYVWLTYRMCYLRRETTIPWEGLQMQFGAEYRRTRDFKAAFLEHLKTVLVWYRKARIGSTSSGLVLKPSPTHVTHQ